MSDALKRIITISALLLITLAILFGGMAIYANVQRGGINTAITDCFGEYTAAYTKSDYTDAASATKELSDKMDKYMTGEAKTATEKELSSVVTYSLAGTKKVTKYEKQVLSVSVDYRYGKTVATVKSLVNFDGFGEYIGGESKTELYTGIATDVCEMQKADGVWKITKISTTYER